MLRLYNIHFKSVLVPEACYTTTDDAVVWYAEGTAHKSSRKLGEIFTSSNFVFTQGLCNLVFLVVIVSS